MSKRLIVDPSCDQCRQFPEWQPRSDRPDAKQCVALIPSYWGSYHDWRRDVVHAYRCRNAAKEPGDLCGQHIPRPQRTTTAGRRAAERDRKAEIMRSHLTYSDVVTLVGWWKTGGESAFDAFTNQ